ncbi:MAG: histidine--tRNA ligase [Desulfurococcales archaeon]|nr:histidine--tRNA ligase [Desulfurococcales archaeon]
MSIQLEPVRGMRDILPPDSEGISVLIREFQNVAELYGYRYVIPPTVELFRLFAIKSGPEISKSMYVFSDKAGREVCLRPEFTASIARIYLKYFRAEPKPIKIYYVGSAFRYEEPQFARYREFIQAGVEYIGDSGIYSDLEQLLLLRDYYSRINLKDYTIKLGSIDILRTLLSGWGVPEKVQDEIIHYLDKKLVDEVYKILNEYPSADKSFIEELISFRAEDPVKLIEFSKSMKFNGKIQEAVDRLAKILEATRKLGIRAYVDLGFARGLAYYTGFIFEVLTPYINVSIGGGGRYDTLISLYGGPKTPGTGFSIGIDRTYIALKQAGIRVGSTMKRCMLIASIEDYSYIDKVASKLRSMGVVVDVRLAPIVKLGDLIGQASRKNYDYVVIVGDREYKESKLTIKNLSTKEQVVIEVDSLEVLP